jgi:hypothetical protein
MNLYIRRRPRFPFIAVAQITRSDSGGQLEARVSIMTMNGCNVDSID